MVIKLIASLLLIIPKTSLAGAGLGAGIPGALEFWYVFIAAFAIASLLFWADSVDDEKSVSTFQNKLSTSLKTIAFINFALAIVYINLGLLDVYSKSTLRFYTYFFTALAFFLPITAIGFLNKSKFWGIYCEVVILIIYLIIPLIYQLRPFNYSHLDHSYYMIYFFYIFNVIYKFFLCLLLLTKYNHHFKKPTKNKKPSLIYDFLRKINITSISKKIISIVKISSLFIQRVKISTEFAISVIIIFFVFFFFFR